ncbi:DUF5134 domain-containing protein [Spirillospora sp. NPDC127506]|jgi:hypothetical protein
MIQATGLRWILTVLFVLLAAYSVWRAVSGSDGRTVGRGGAAARVAHVLHAVMAAAMAAMVWSWGMDLPAWPQVVFFTLAALWFVGIALAFPGGAPRSRALLIAFPHALVMGAMAWMVHAMAAAMSGHHGMGDAMGHGSGAHTHHVTDTSAIASMTLQGGSRAAAGVLAAIMLALTLWWLARAFGPARADAGMPCGGTADPVVRRRDCAVLDLGCHGAMALGMAVMFALLVWDGAA